ncbi:MAG TPA: two-component regulator propeller domain-containing protein [Oleiagrimonas sp.]|nr:two-component regulator propeller domain-containing protein [Oleiagrimonas sp.]
MGISALVLAATLAGAPMSGAVSLPATPQFRHYDINEGLPSSNVYTVVQDRRGVMWMGTRAGLVRYDGSDIKVYRHKPGDATSLASNDVSMVLADSKGRLWAGGEGSGVNLLDPVTGTFRHFRHDPEDPHSLANNDVMTMAEGGDGSLWVGMYGAGLDHMTTPGHFVHLTHVKGEPNSLVSNNVLSLFSRGKGRVWIGTMRGMDIRDPDGSLRHVRFEGLSKAPVVWRIEGDAQHVRADTSAGLFVVGADAVARRLGAGKLPSRNVFASVRDTHGALWVGTNNGLYLLQSDGRCTHFPARPLLPGGQPGRLIWQLTLDDEGGLWVATQNGGVAYLSPDWRDFSHFSHRPDDPTSLSASRILALAGDGHGKVWVGGVDGQLDKLDPNTGAITHHAQALGLESTSVTALARAGDHGLWVGYHDGLGIFDAGHLRKVDDPRLARGVHWIISSASGVAYASPPGRGVLRVDPDSLEVRALAPAFKGTAGRETTGLAMHDGTLWTASRAGLAYLGGDGLQLHPVKGVTRGPIAAMGFAGDDLWLARPHALEHYRIVDDRATLVVRVGADAGWPGAQIKALDVDKRGRVWLFATAGLWRYDPSTHSFHRYGQPDGLPSAEFTSNELVHLPGGIVLAGTLRGVVGFQPAAEQDHPRPPALVLTSAVVRRDGRDVRLSLADHALDLHWDDRDLRITAQALSYIQPGHNHYRFRLTGFDPTWVDTGTRGTRELAGLAAGHYELKVQAAGPSGAWSRLSTPLSIDVAAPPWQRPWAWALYVLLVLVTGYLLFAAWRRRLEQRHRVQMAEQQRHMAEQASAAKSRFLANLSHEIRTPMTGVLGMAELLEDTRDPRQRRCAEAIRHSGELLLKLVNDALDLARIEAGRFELEPGSMNPRRMLTETRQLLLGLARNKQLELSAETDATVPPCLRGDALRIKQILLNLANNAIKFTPEGGVYLRAEWRDGELVLHVRDTGPGICAKDRERLFGRFEQADTPERDSGSGLGLAICRELTALMHGRITLDSEPGKGSHFMVFLPLPEMAAEAEPAPVAKAAPTPSRRVLLVEDNATVAHVISGLLEARGHRVTHAAHSLDALAALDGDGFDLMLLDLDLPGMNGYQLAGLIRQREPGRDLPIAAITARSGGDEETRALDAGMNAFARKPLTGAQLAALIEDLCPDS